MLDEKNCKGRDCLSNRSTEGQKILKQICRETGCKGVDWIGWIKKGSSGRIL
jgi:hypothetical protein